MAPTSAPARDEAAVRRRALDLLAIREHAASELRLKLRQRLEVPEAVIDAVLEELTGEGLLDERRFVEAFVRSRRSRGQGPLRVEAELRRRQIPAPLIREGLEGMDGPVDWAEACREARIRRFGAARPKERDAWARQVRFLRGRGFADRDIRAAVSDDPE